MKEPWHNSTLLQAAIVQGDRFRLMGESLPVKTFPWGGLQQVAKRWQPCRKQ